VKRRFVLRVLVPLFTAPYFDILTLVLEKNKLSKRLKYHRFAIAPGVGYMLECK
jgi:hypothetical protein